MSGRRSSSGRRVSSIGLLDGMLHIVENLLANPLENLKDRDEPSEVNGIKGLLSSRNEIRESRLAKRYVLLCGEVDDRLKNDRLRVGMEAIDILRCVGTGGKVELGSREYAQSLAAGGLE